VTNDYVVNAIIDHNLQFCLVHPDCSDVTLLGGGKRRGRTAPGDTIQRGDTRMK